MPISVSLPLRLVSEANSRDHWAVKAKRAREQRSVVRMRLGAMFGEVAGKLAGVPWLITITRVSPGTLDAHDNLPRSCKAVVDGLCDALGVKDNDPRVSFRYAQEKVKRATKGRVPANKYAVRILIECADQKEENK